MMSTNDVNVSMLSGVYGLADVEVSFSSGLLWPISHIYIDAPKAIWLKSVFNFQ